VLARLCTKFPQQRCKLFLFLFSNFHVLDAETHDTSCGGQGLGVWREEEKFEGTKAAVACAVQCFVLHITRRKRVEHQSTTLSILLVHCDSYISVNDSQFHNAPLTPRSI